MHKYLAELIDKLPFVILLQKIQLKSQLLPSFWRTIDWIYHSYISIFLAYIDTQTMETMLELYSRNGRSKTSSFHQPLLYNSSWALGELRTNLESTWMFALNKFQELSKELKEEIKDSNKIKRNVNWHCK